MNKKGVLGITGGLVALCLCLGAAGFIALRSAGWFLSRTVVSDTQTVSTTGAAIADYTLPDGFDDGYAANVGGFSLVSYTAVDGQSHIYLLQAPPALKLDQAQMEQQGNLSTGSNGWAEVQVIEQQPCQIRGQETTLVISEGINHDGQQYRSASAVFDGNDGLALVNISGPATGWDQEMVDTFIESLN